MPTELNDILRELHSIKTLLHDLLGKKDIAIDFNSAIDVKHHQDKQTTTTQTDTPTTEKWSIVDEWTNEPSPPRENEWTVVTSRRPTKRREVPVPAPNAWLNENPFRNLQFVENQETEINSRFYKNFEDAPPTVQPGDTEDNFSSVSAHSNSRASSFNPPQCYQSSQSQSRRPNVVTSQFPENDDPAKYRRVKTVPGEKIYSRAHVKNITLVTDSIGRGLRNREFNEELKNFGIRDVWCDVCKLRHDR